MLASHVSQECKDINHCRTLQNIIYTCFSTIFLCTWVGRPTFERTQIPQEYHTTSPCMVHAGCPYCPRGHVCFCFQRLAMRFHSIGMASRYGMGSIPCTDVTKNVFQIAAGPRCTSNLHKWVDFSLSSTTAHQPRCTVMTSLIMPSTAQMTFPACRRKNP